MRTDGLESRGCNLPGQLCVICKLKEIEQQDQCVKRRQISVAENIHAERTSIELFRSIGQQTVGLANGMSFLGALNGKRLASSTSAVLPDLPFKILIRGLFQDSNTTKHLWPRVVVVFSTKNRRLIQMVEFWGQNYSKICPATAANNCQIV